MYLEVCVVWQLHNYSLHSYYLVIPPLMISNRMIVSFAFVHRVGVEEDSDRELQNFEAVRTVSTWPPQASFTSLPSGGVSNGCRRSASLVDVVR